MKKMMSKSEQKMKMMMKGKESMPKTRKSVKKRK